MDGYIVLSVYYYYSYYYYYYYYYYYSHVIAQYISYLLPLTSPRLALPRHKSSQVRSGQCYLVHPHPHPHTHPLQPQPRPQTQINHSPITPHIPLHPFITASPNQLYTSSHTTYIHHSLHPPLTTSTSHPHPHLQPRLPAQKACSTHPKHA